MFTLSCSSINVESATGFAIAICGGGVYVTLNMSFAVDLLPDPSVATYVTVVSPTGRLAGASLDSVGCSSTVSVATTCGSLIGIPAGSVASRAIGEDGIPDITGGVRSTTRTVRFCCAEFPEKSVAVYVRTVSPNGKTGGAFTESFGFGSTESTALIC